MKYLLSSLIESYEIKKFESVITEVSATHIIKVTSIFTVTASAEHIPKIWSAIGWSISIGLQLESTFDTWDQLEL